MSKPKLTECFECGLPGAHRHHVVPQSVGGTKSVSLCVDCHSLAHTNGNPSEYLLNAVSSFRRAVVINARPQSSEVTALTRLVDNLKKKVEQVTEERDQVQLAYDDVMARQSEAVASMAVVLAARRVKTHNDKRSVNAHRAN